MIDDGTSAGVGRASPRAPLRRLRPYGRRPPRPPGRSAACACWSSRTRRRQWAGKLMGDLGADVIKIEPPGGQSTRTVGPFYQDMPDREKSLYFWHYNTSKRGITLDLETEDGRRLFRKLADGADVILESYNPGYHAIARPGLRRPEGEQPGPDHVLADVVRPDGAVEGLHRQRPAAPRGGRPDGLLRLLGRGPCRDAPPIAPGGGQAWHTGSHFACIGIISALMHRTRTGRGQYIDTSVHESCALTTEMHVNTWIYTKQVVQRQTGRHAAAQPNQKSQHMCGDGKFVNVGAQIVTRITGEQLKVLRGWYEELGLPVDLIDEKEKNPEVITDNELFMMLLASATRDQIYHGGQKRGFNLGAVRAPDEVMEDPHLEDRGFWTAVEQPQVGKSFLHPGPAGIFNGSPWRISRRAPMIGEHNEEVLCGELGLSRAELAVHGRERSGLAAPIPALHYRSLPNRHGCGQPLSHMRGAARAKGRV